MMTESSYRVREDQHCPSQDDPSVQILKALSELKNLECFFKTSRLIYWMSHSAYKLYLLVFNYRRTSFCLGFSLGFNLQGVFYCSVVSQMLSVVALNSCPVALKRKSSSSSADFTDFTFQFGDSQYTTS